MIKNYKVNREKYVKLRVTALEKKVLFNKAKLTSSSFSDYARNVLFGHRVSSKLSEEELINFKMLHRFNKDLINLKNWFSKKDPRLSSEIEHTCLEIRKQLNKFK